MVTSGIWKVVGGIEKGGILVRTGKDTTSLESSDRLATGALVSALEHVDGRLHYSLMTGQGPAKGWVSTKLRGKDLLMKLESQLQPAETNEATVPTKISTLSSSPSALAALRAYGQRFGGANEADRKAPEIVLTNQAHAENEEQSRVSESICNAAQRPSLSTYDENRVCAHCQLPLGESCYDRDGQSVHGECKAQLMVHDLRKAEEARWHRETAEKRVQREKFGIGWESRHIPRNVDPVFKLTLQRVPQGMVCLTLSEDARARSLQVAATTEPAAAVNLEYLSTALRIRRLEGHEPYFSLDPVDPARKLSMQRKVFVPKWLANTSAGEVLFQADYYLKELSMGEYEQPVVGMSSCFDHSETEGHEAWSGREWFMVRKAEVNMSRSKVLIPYVKMGVEAREQQIKGGALEDVPITRPDHPMVKFAEAFTRNFDLIAERRSVIYHLRDLAKATVLAKFVEEAQLSLADSWFRLGDSSSSTECRMEVPQLWNERVYSQIQVRDGAIIYDRQQGKTIHASTHSIYGGVTLGLGQFRVSTPAITKVVPALKDVVEHRAVLTRSLNVDLVTIKGPRSSLMATAMGPGFNLKLGARIAAAGALVPSQLAVPGARGVDLRLDNVLKTTPEDEDALPFGDCNGLDTCSAVGNEFWAVLEGQKLGNDREIFKGEDKALFKDIFNPSLTDRRAEGDCFIPPVGSPKYVSKLRNLLKEEAALREKRIGRFLSKSFVMGDPGLLFPSSWTPKAEISRGESPDARPTERRQQGALQVVEDKEAALHVLPQAAPVFDRSTEDGLRFRIYQLGSLELRTTQKHDGKEEVGIVFSIRAPPRADPWDPWDERVREQERLVKATAYVERSYGQSPCCSPRPCQYYVVLETETGHKLVTEQRGSGQTTWLENPEDLEDRSSLAKVITSTECLSGCTVREIREYQVSHSLPGHPADASICERYVRGACHLARGGHTENKK